jgi:NAD(P)-dependent dehydrogenase (short-subunit alcohol dehydrogenase family)
MGTALKGRRVVITGASSGIGLATARRLAQEGARVALMARNPEGLEAAQRAVAEEGSTAVIHPVDVTDRPALEQAMTAAAQELGGIDVLVPAAAAQGFGAFTKLSPEDFDRTHDVTFRGAVNTIRAGLPELERSGGTIVAIVSMASKIPMPLQSPYVAAKFALRGFLGSLRVELHNRRSDVEVCMIHPAYIGTPFFEHATSAEGTRPEPLRPVYRVEEVADAVLACILHPRAEMHVGGSATALNILRNVARPLTELLLATYGVAGQRSGEPAPQPGMLWEPSGKGRAVGTVRGRPSLWTKVRLAAGFPLDVADSLPGVRRVVRLVR